MSSLFNRVVEGCVNEVGDVLIGQGVEHVLASSSAFDEVFRPKEAKLLRDGRKADARGFGKLRNAPFALGEALEQPEAGLVARHPKEPRGTLECIIGN